MKFKPDLKVILATFLMALVMLPVMAQERQVTGTVYEPDGVTPVFGATVVLKVPQPAPAQMRGEPTR